MLSMGQLRHTARTAAPSDCTHHNGHYSSAISTSAHKKKQQKKKQTQCNCTTSPCWSPQTLPSLFFGKGLASPDQSQGLSQGCQHLVEVQTHLLNVISLHQQPPHLISWCVPALISAISSSYLVGEMRLASHGTEKHYNFAFLCPSLSSAFTSYVSPLSRK